MQKYASFKKKIYIYIYGLKGNEGDCVTETNYVEQVERGFPETPGSDDTVVECLKKPGNVYSEIKLSGMNKQVPKITEVESCSVIKIRIVVQTKIGPTFPKGVEMGCGEKLKNL